MIGAAQNSRITAASTADTGRAFVPNVRQTCAKDADYTECKKDRAENSVIFNPGDASEEER
jgi:hypothetical protein